MKSFVKFLAAKFGYEFVRRGCVSDDFDPLAQQQRLLAGVASSTILDFGAHVGETSQAYLKLVPQAQIHALEPFAESFEKLKRNLAQFPPVKVHPLGLADRCQQMMLNVNPFDATNSLLATDRRTGEVWGTGELNFLSTRLRLVVSGRLGVYPLL